MDLDGLGKTELGLTELGQTELGRIKLGQKFLGHGQKKNLSVQCSIG